VTKPSIERGYVVSEHGNVANRPDLYDLLFGERVDETEMYLRFMDPDRVALEYGVGSGRLAIPLARRGRSIVGIDSSEVMLARLNERLDRENSSIRERIVIKHGDARLLSLGSTFQLVYAPFMMFNYLMTLQDQVDFLRMARLHLADDGLLVLEAMTAATLPELFLNDGLSRKVLHVNNDVNERTFEMSRVVRYDFSTQLVEQDRHFRFYSDGRLIEEECVTWRNRFCSLSELRILLQVSGLEVLNEYGSHSLAPFDSSSKYLIVQCRAV